MFTQNCPPMEGTVCVATVYNPVDASIIRDLLDQNAIPSIKTARYALDPLPTLAGSSVFGEDIYVPEAAAEEALAIVQAFTQSGSDQAVEPGSEFT